MMNEENQFLMIDSFVSGTVWLLQFETGGGATFRAEVEEAGAVDDQGMLTLVKMS